MLRHRRKQTLTHNKPKAGMSRVLCTRQCVSCVMCQARMHASRGDSRVSVEGLVHSVHLVPVDGHRLATLLSIFHSHRCELEGRGKGGCPSPALPSTSTRFARFAMATVTVTVTV